MSWTPDGEGDQCYWLSIGWELFAVAHPDGQWFAQVAFTDGEAPFSETGGKEDSQVAAMAKCEKYAKEWKDRLERAMEQAVAEDDNESKPHVWVNDPTKTYLSKPPKHKWVCALCGTWTLVIVGASPAPGQCK